MVNQQYVINGRTKTLAELCVQNEIPFTTMCKRLKSGWTIEEAIEPIESLPITFSIDDSSKAPDTLALEQWCELLGLDKNDTYLRILHGESFKNIVAE